MHNGKTELNKAMIRRRADALCLRRQKHWRGAMYLMGYALECKLKVRLMERYNVDNLKQLDAKLQPKQKKPIDTKTHNIEYLFSFTGARSRLAGVQGDQNLKDYFLCQSWRAEWRYHPGQGQERECEQFFEAVERFLQFIHNNV